MVTPGQESEVRCDFISRITTGPGCRHLWFNLISCYIFSTVDTIFSSIDVCIKYYLPTEPAKPGAQSAYISDNSYIPHTVDNWQRDAYVSNNKRLAFL